MILPYLSELNKKRIILASGSPRRKELLEGIGLNFEIITSNEDEDGDRSDPIISVEQNAYKKGRSVADTNGHFDFVISADTIVFHKNEILEKPTSEERAFELLTKISNDTHTVVTGVSIITPKTQFIFSEQTTVTIDELSDQFISDYIKSGEPMDKAGAYGIQKNGASFITRIEGCYYNVMGFPVNSFVKKIIPLINCK